MRLKKKPRNLPRIYNNLIYDINGILTERNNEFAVSRDFLKMIERTLTTNRKNGKLVYTEIKNPDQENAKVTTV